MTEASPLAFFRFLGFGASAVDSDVCGTSFGSVVGAGGSEGAADAGGATLSASTCFAFRRLFLAGASSVVGAVAGVEVGSETTRGGLEVSAKEISVSAFFACFRFFFAGGSSVSDLEVGRSGEIGSCMEGVGFEAGETMFIGVALLSSESFVMVAALRFLPALSTGGDERGGSVSAFAEAFCFF